jgi:hypothetical protein
MVLWRLEEELRGGQRLRTSTVVWFYTVSGYHKNPNISGNS